ncbi:MAG: class I SAM-dependent methyltransferase [Nocardioides sp.]
MSWWERQVVPRVTNFCCGLGDVDKLRSPVCEGLHGRVLEVGFGTGHNIRHYPATVTQIAAIEPSDLSWRMARTRIASSPVEIRRDGLDGQRLDLPDDSFDCALSTFTMCTIPDLGAALTEVRRVLRSEGTLHFVEHGLSPDPKVARRQRQFEPLNRRIAGGCRLTRTIDEHIERAGFELARIERFYDFGPKPFGYIYRGSAKLS